MNNLTINPVQSFVDDTNSWQKSMRDSANAANTSKIMDNAKTMYQAWLNTQDSKTKNNYMSWSNINSLAWAIITYADSKWKYDDYAWLESTQVVDKFLRKNPWRWYEEWINQFTGWKIWFDDVTRRIWINQTVSEYLLSEDMDDEEFDPRMLSDYNEEEWGDSLGESSPNTWKKWALWTAWAILGWIAWAYWVPSAWYWGWKFLDWAWNKMFESTVSTSEKEASLSSNMLWEKYKLDDNVTEAEKGLKEAKKKWKWIKEAQEVLDNAKKAKSDFIKNEWKKEVVKTRDTIKEPLGKSITRWWTAEQRAWIAKKEADNIYEKIINPLLDKSKSTIKLSDVFSEMESDIDKISYKWRRDALKEIFDEFKNSIHDSDEISLKEADKLKKDLWEQTPQKYFNGKDVSSEWRQLEADLWTKIKNKFHEILSKEAWIDTAKKYLDYHNWMDYKKAQDKLAKEPLFKGSVQDTIWKLSEWWTQKLWYYMSKLWEWLEKNSKKAYDKIVKGSYDKIVELINAVKKDPKLLLKWWKWLLDPVALLMPDFSYESFQEYNNSLDKKLLDDRMNDFINENWGQEITEDEWKALIWEEWYSLINENWRNTLADKWWTNEWLEALIDSLE